MSCTLKIVTGWGLFCALLALQSAQAYTLIPVPPVTGSTSTDVYAINNDNVIAGGWFDSIGVEHGFFGTLAGSYTTFDYAGAGVTGTEARGINDNDYITGWAPATNFVQGYEFIRNPDGTMVTITKNGVALDGIPQQILSTNGNPFAGNYWPDSTDRYAYLGKNGVWKKDVNLPTDWSFTQTSARGINDAGAVTGFFLDENGATHGLLLQTGTATQIDYPDKNAVGGTYMPGINDSGLATGFWIDGNGNSHAFKLDTTSDTFTPIRVPGAAAVEALGVNNAGLIAVGTNIGSYIYCPGRPKDCPAIGRSYEVPDSPPVKANLRTYDDRQPKHSAQQAQRARARAFPAAP